MRTRIIWSLMLIMSMVLAGCGQEDITADRIVEKMREAQANTTDMHAVVTVDFSSREESGSITGEYWMLKSAETNADGKPIEKVRAEITDSTMDEAKGVMAVMNGESGWFYTPSDNVAVVGTPEDLANMEQNQSENTNGPTDQMDMLMELQGFVQQGLDAVDIEILGEEEIAGQNAYKLSITPKKEAQQELQLPIELLVDITVWVDSERWMPLKLIVDAKEMGKLEVTAQQLDINSGLDASLFDIAPPAGATIKPLSEIMAEMDKQGGMERPADIEEAQTQVDFSILKAGDEAAGAVLVDLQTMQMPQGTTVIQAYSGPGVQWSLVQSKGDMAGERSMNSGTSTKVEVRGISGSIMEGSSGSRTLLTWQEGEITYVLAGNISAEQALAIANDLQ